MNSLRIFGFNSLYVLLISLMFLPIVQAQDNQNLGEPGRDSKKPNPLNNVYFGEQHLHSEMSPDAYAMGVRQKMEDAYRYGTPAGAAHWP